VQDAGIETNLMERLPDAMVDGALHAAAARVAELEGVVE
jgi:hypothetical protein